MMFDKIGAAGIQKAIMNRAAERVDVTQVEPGAMEEYAKASAGRMALDNAKLLAK